ncbi:MAG: dihydrolipoyl dehydrogenase [Burkholderiaceae bacterium]|nr:dihydrolipoyl dehydrogenase [Burkholderiaceae bacterium]
MRQLTTDVAVIGAGTAGLAAYRAAIAAGKHAVLIEGGPYGTTCARVGCMPSKLLIAAAEAAHHARHTAAFGVHVDGDVRVDGRAVMDRVKRERDRFVGFVLDGVESIPAEHKIRGFARFIAPGLLQIDAHTRVRAAAVVIATGSSAFIPESFRALGDRLVLNDDVFDWDDLPRRVAVFGPGVIGLELGQALARLDVAVRVFGESGSIGGISDPRVRSAACGIFQQEFYLDPNARVLDTKRVGDEVEIRYVALDNTERVERFDVVLMATGRRPNTAFLDLDRAGIPLGAQGVPVFDRETMQVGDTAVFIAGDVNADVPLLHEAADEGKIAGDNAARFPAVRAGLRRASLGVVFSDPQIALIGIPFKQLGAGTFVTGAVDFSNQGRSRVMLKNKGLLHVYADVATRRFLGAEMIGPSAEHIGHLLAWAAQQSLTIDQMLEMPFYHPVIEEGLRTALREAQALLDRAGVRLAA